MSSARDHSIPILVSLEEELYSLWKGCNYSELDQSVEILVQLIRSLYPKFFPKEDAKSNPNTAHLSINGDAVDPFLTFSITPPKRNHPLHLKHDLDDLAAKLPKKLDNHQRSSIIQFVCSLYYYAVWLSAIWKTKFNEAEERLNYSEGNPMI